MPRRTRSALLVAVLATLATTGLVVLPTVTTASAAPRPVPASVDRIELGDLPVPAAKAGAALRRPVSLVTPQRSTEPYSLMGVTWAPDPAVGEVVVDVRHRSDGAWSGWTRVEGEPDDAPDAGSADATSPGFRLGTAPVWTGPSDGVQVRVTSLSGTAPRDVAVELVDPGTSPADALVQPRDAASAEAGEPDIVTREQWGADESIRRGSPTYNSTVRVGFVHHTASSNDYTPEQAAAMVRGIYAYHVKSNGWSDIGYNFLVDRFGRAYEGRAGGVDRFVFGAHTGGFNKDSFAVSLLGDFSTVPPTETTLDTVEDLLAWKLGQAYRDPLGTAVLTSAGGGTSKYAAGTRVEFDVVSGHRDAGSTTCPGATTYARLDDIRAGVSDGLGVGFVDPVVEGATEVPRGSRGPVAVTAAVRGARELDWAFTVRDSSGGVLRTGRGSTAEGDDPAGAWDLTDVAGEPVRPGRYELELEGSTDDDRALPLVVEVVVEGTPCRGTPLQRALCKAARRG